jgi:hypothetical protein
MKKILVLLLAAITLSANAQIPELKLTPNVISGNISGGSIKKGDTIQVSLIYKAATGYPVRSFYLDFQHQITAINMIGIKFPTAGTQGSAIPAGATTSFQNQYYPGYYFNRNTTNTTESGQLNSNNASYLYTQNGNKAINRIWAVSSGNLVDGKLCDIQFRVEQVQAGFTYDSIYYNFAQAFSGNYGGTYYDVKMPKPNSAWVDVLATSNALINGELKVNGLTEGYRPQVIIVDSATGIVKANILPSPNGIFTVSSELAPNTAYKAYVAIKSDSIPAILSKAITVSDYTAAATEFVKQNLDGTFSNSNIASGVGFLAADVNNNKTFDGGDVTAIFAQAVGADTIFKAQTGQSIWNVPAFLTTTYDTLTINGWKSLTDVYTVNFKTSNVATDLKINYLIPGDINRSHSSPRTQAQNVTTYSTRDMVINSITGAMSYVNTGNNNISAIDVNLNNLTVISNNIEIPFSIDTKGSNVSALQFEIVYDPAKVKFEEIKSEVPNTWFVFANPKNGVLRFGAIDKELKTPINGISAPFKLKFSSVEAGVDLNTRIKITQNIDASDNKGNQLGINLNTTNIKLTGYNNF